MAWTAPATAVTGDIITAAFWNAARDNFLETAVAKVTTQGDILYATGANTLTRLAKGTAAQSLVMNAGATAPEWGGASLAIPEFWHPEIIHGMTATGETTLTANQAYFVPMRPLTANVTINTLVSGRLLAQSGNVDVGIYSWDGTTMTRAVSLGSTPCPAAAYRLSFNIADTALLAGTRYFYALSFDNAIASIYFYNLQAETNWTAWAYQAASAFPLPSTVTGLTNYKTATPLLIATVSGGLAL